MSYVKGICIKCGGYPIFKIPEETTLEEFNEMLKNRDFGHCSVGWHVELGSMDDYYIIDWSTMTKDFDFVTKAQAFPGYTSEEVLELKRNNMIMSRKLKLIDTRDYEDCLTPDQFYDVDIKKTEMGIFYSLIDDRGNLLKTKLRDRFEWRKADAV